MITIDQNELILRTALQKLVDEVSSVFTLSCDAIVNTGDGWSCKSCGMELDTGGTHKADCLTSRILDLADALYASEDALKQNQRERRVMKNENDLIPCTVELERLKIFLGAWSQLKKNAAASRVRVARYYEGRPPYAVEEFTKQSKRFIALGARLLAENRQGWIDSLKGGPFPKI